MYYRKVLMVAGCSALLTGCASFRDHFGSVLGPREEVKVANDSPAAADIPISQMAQYMSGGSVEVYSLDGDGPAPAGPQGDGGVPAGNDSSVTVFPFEGAGASAYDMPGIMPPSRMRQDYPSPFHDTQPVRVLFGHDSSALTAPAKQMVDGIALSASSGPLQVEGHASARAAVKDPVQRHMVNLKMSMDRALSVSRELMRKGVPAESIETTAFGDTHPAPEGEAASRRVEIYTGSSGH